ncbi:hypothetical protein H7849_18295 [Alloacidobacterium dinghuense]|uniref:Potassium channel domain-containing protein n=1 Tax=Alloacidobacterium dinghuense TaxID=2763107 RepID=A0A7G8BES1_9BACT|nr:potassium channel family protein [Alloacidobacterium dinghuense]QNI31041.1 hypothetical protein H7849_18295 [Alloacidobacterium dinghuense]
MFLSALMFVPVILSTVKLSQTKRWMRVSVLLMLGVLALGVASVIWPNRTLLGIKWGLLAVFFCLAVIGLFSYLRNAGSVTSEHLYTAMSIYLLLGMAWFAVYCAMDVVYPGSFGHPNNTVSDRQSELLYFSLITLSTVGYGDVVPLQSEARMLAALEGITGVLYVAITVAILVSAYRRQNSSDQA